MANVYLNPLLAAEPYEEEHTEASPGDLKAYYDEMSRKEALELERKASKKKKSGKWTRRLSVKRSTAPPPSSTTNRNTLPRQHPAPPRPNLPTIPSSNNESEMEKLEDIPKAPIPVSQKSIVPDSLRDLPAWYSKDTYNSVAFYRTKFPMHNPVGPRYYRNHHLIPPSMLRPGSRPPSIFSPSFPAMATSSTHEPSEDSTRIPTPSRTPSASPLPTPTSSETRVAEAGNTRSRKTSQTAHDNVDLLDASDPWGTNWHHQSPYDIGLSNNTASADVERSRHASAQPSSIENRRRTVTPSPLSQSTSAVHLQPPDHGARLPRKLSKRKTLSQTPSNANAESDSASISLPVTPAEEIGYPLSKVNSEQTPQRMSVVGPPNSFRETSKKEKRGSILGRLAKKFSLMRKPHGDDRRQSVMPLERLDRQPSPEKVSKRVAPPTLETDNSAFSVKREGSLEKQARERRDSAVSAVSLETPFSMGKLTVANPDAPSSNENTPLQPAATLPSELAERPTPGPSNLSQFDMSTSSSPTSVSPPPPPTAFDTPSSERSPPPPPVPSPAQSPAPAIAVAAAPFPVFSAAPVESAPPFVVSPNPPPKPVEKFPSPTPPIPLKSRTRTSSNEPRVASSKSTDKLPTPLPYQTEHRRKPPPDVTPKPLEKLSAPVASSSKRTSSEVAKMPRSPEKKPDAPKSKPNIVFPDPKSPDMPAYLAALVATDGNDGLDNSPLSTLSMVANPPTPYNADVPIPTPTPPPPAPPPKRTSFEGRRDPSPGVNPATGRQTETFRLVRSASGTVYASGETIRAAGEQWEVVEQVRSSSGSRDKESGRRLSEERDSKRIHRSEDSSRTSGKNKALPIPNGMETSTSPEVEHHQHKSKSQRREEEKSRGRQRAQTNVDKPQPSVPQASSSGSQTQRSVPRPAGRHHSISARPTSEGPSSADLNATRAKEAFEMERLWKAKSMYSTDSHVPAQAPASVAPAASNSAASIKSVYGSSHTSFTVQNTFGSPIGSHIYHSMPAVPAPVIYPSSSPTGEHRHHSQSAPDIVSPVSTSRVPLSNPLPEPPRESEYIPHDIAEKSATEYWTKYAGVTTAH